MPATPGGQNREHARELGWIPSACRARRSLPPEAERLPFKQMRAMLEGSQDARLGRNDGVTGEQPRLQLIDVVAGFEPVRQYQRPGQTGDRDAVLPVAAVVVSFNRRHLDGQQPPLAEFGVE